MATFSSVLWVVRTLNIVWEKTKNLENICYETSPEMEKDGKQWIYLTIKDMQVNKRRTQPKCLKMHYKQFSKNIVPRYKNNSKCSMQSQTSLVNRCLKSPHLPVFTSTLRRIVLELRLRRQIRKPQMLDLTPPHNCVIWSQINDISRQFNFNVFG